MMMHQTLAIQAQDRCQPFTISHCLLNASSLQLTPMLLVKYYAVTLILGVYQFNVLRWSVQLVLALKRYGLPQGQPRQLKSLSSDASVLLQY